MFGIFARQPVKEEANEWRIVRYANHKTIK